MADTQKKYVGRPALTWVSVRASDGRTHMEARWTPSTPQHARAA